MNIKPGMLCQILAGGRGDQVAGVCTTIRYVGDTTHVRGDLVIDIFDAWMCRSPEVGDRQVIFVSTPYLRPIHDPDDESLRLEESLLAEYRERRPEQVA